MIASAPTLISDHLQFNISRAEMGNEEAQISGPRNPLTHFMTTPSWTLQQTQDISAGKFESLERINSIREITGNF